MVLDTCDRVLQQQGFEKLGVLLMHLYDRCHWGVYIYSCIIWRWNMKSVASIVSFGIFLDIYTILGIPDSCTLFSC